MAQSHSDKALETLSQMQTAPENWRLATIEWKREKAFVDTKVECPRCNGRGEIYIKDNEFVCSKYGYGEAVRQYFNLPASPSLSYNYVTRWIKESGVRLTACDTCPTRRNYYIGTGEVVAFVEREVLVGYVIWDEGTKFDSRFNHSNGNSKTHCELCAKGINLTNRMPVQGIDAHGNPHGMFVGEDCARKILSVKASIKKDHFIKDNLKPKP